MARVRPSSLALAKVCPRAPWLSAKHNESRDVTRLGSEVDRQISALLAGCDLLEDVRPEVDVLLTWVRAAYPSEQWEWFPQMKVELIDPETGEVLTQGTLDLLCRHRTEPRVALVDWKKKGQLWAGHLPAPDTNPQLRAYVASAWLKLSLERPIESADLVLACWDEKGVKEIRNEKPFTADTLWEVIAEVQAVPPVDLDGAQPEASIGDHCDHCYQRFHCDAHLLPGALALANGIPALACVGAGSVQIDAAGVAAALAWIEKTDAVLATAKAIREVVEDQVNAYVAAHGPVTVGELAYGPVEVKGRRCGATVATLEKEGLKRLIREPKASVKYRWSPLKNG